MQYDGIVLSVRKGKNGKNYAEVAVLGVGAFSAECPDGVQVGAKVKVEVTHGVYQGRLSARAAVTQ